LGHTFATVYSRDYTTTVGINTFNFSTPFVWDGTSNIVVQCCFDNEGKAGPALYPDFVAGNTYPLGAGVRSSAFSNFITGAAAGCNLPAALVVDGRFNALLGADCGLNPIATETSSQATHYLNAGNSLYYFDNNANIIAGVTNLSGNDMRCTRVAIERQGTGATRFWNANKQNFLTDKAYHVSTGGPGKYRITLYFTRGEKEGWEAATGNAWSQVQLVRTTGSIANVTPANAKPNNNGTVAEVVNPVHGAYGDGFTLTGVFTGSGGIAAGAPGRQFNVVAAAQASQALASDMPVATSQFVQVINNPFGSELRLRFAQPLASNATAALMDVQGKVLVSATLAKGSTTAGINTASRNIQSSNVYMLRITQGGRSYVVKVLKQ
jgi:hypothetical protein